MGSPTPISKSTKCSLRRYSNREGLEALISGFQMHKTHRLVQVQVTRIICTRLIKKMLTIFMIKYYYFLNCEKLLNWKMRNAKIGKNYQKKRLSKYVVLALKLLRSFLYFELLSIRI